MNFLARRRLKKNVQQAQHVVRHALNMREDIAPAEHIAAARAAAGQLAAGWAARDWAGLPAACEASLAAAEQLMPPRSFPMWRENVEVLVVAIALAMACRQSALSSVPCWRYMYCRCASCNALPVGAA